MNRKHTEEKEFLHEIKAEKTNESDEKGAAYGAERAQEFFYRLCGAATFGNPDEDLADL